MKIGQKPELPSAAAQAASSAKQQARAAAPGADAIGKNAATAKAAGAPVTLSSNVSHFEPASRSAGDFDVDRVNAMRAAIENGTFKFNAEAIADKILSSAYEAFSRVSA